MKDFGEIRTRLVRGTLCNSCGEGLSGMASQISRARSGPENDEAGDAAAIARANVTVQMSGLRESSPTIREAVDSGRLELIGSMYDMSMGAVELI